MYMPTLYVAVPLQQQGPPGGSKESVLVGIGIGIGIDLKSTKVARVLMTAHSQTARTASKEPIYDSRSKISQK